MFPIGSKEDGWSDVKLLASLWWVRLPVAVATVSRTLAAILADGGYLARWPAVAALAPPLAALWGVLLSQTRTASQETYTYSVLGLTVAVAIAGFGAGLGAYLVVAYAVCDFFVFQHQLSQTTLRLAQLLSYLVLALVMVLAPVSARIIRRRTLANPSRLKQAGPAVDGVLAAMISGGLVFLWTEAAAVLIRPVFVWTEAGVPTDEAIHPLQQLGWILALAAAGVAAVRVRLEAEGSSMSAAVVEALRRPGSGGRLPPPIASLLEGALLTLLMAGFFDSWLQVPAAFAALTAVALARRLGSNWLPIWPRLLARIPMLIRLVASIAAAIFVGQSIVATQFSQTTSLWPVALAALSAIAIMTILVPDIGTPRTQPGGTR
jgi:hypothetical protein